MHPWLSLISILSEITRKNSTLIICCPHCGNQYTYIKWGVYYRYLFNDELVAIQRYRCHNDLCPRKTFSVLPHAFLRIVRATLCMLMYMLNLHEKGHRIADIARHTRNSWPRTQRLIAKALSIRDWVKSEYSGGLPCLAPDKMWAHFVRDFSWAFYPARYQ
jgi:transposase-like protein